MVVVGIERHAYANHFGSLVPPLIFLYFTYSKSCYEH